MSSTTITPAAPAEDDRRKRAWRPLAAAAAAGSVLLITGFGVWASLNATATSTSTVATGTLKLVMSDNGVGFTQTLANLAPGDTVNRFVKLTNSGTLDGKALSLQVAATGSNALITDGVSPVTTKAAQMTVVNCTVPWTIGSNTATCSGGTTSTLLGPVALSALASPNALANTSSIAANTGALNLKISIAVPDQTETTVNGALPTTTIQNATAQLAYTFAETQRDAAATTS